MPDPTLDDATDLADTVTDEDLVYEPPPELADEGGGRAGHAGRAPRSIALRLAAVAAVALVIAAALLAYRAQQRRKVVAAGISKAEALIRLDTAAAYREAASLLEPIAQLDPIQGASVRAFTLAMLLADYREASAQAEIEALLVAPGRAEQVPAYAQLAAAALALRRKEAGTATTAIARAGAGPCAQALQARVALLAGNVDAALAPAASAASAEGAFAAGLSLHGDVLRRLRRDPAAARAAYEAALSASPLHPRSAYGLAKLALSGDVHALEAERGLKRLLDDRDRTPAPERARAALHLASLRMRAGDRAGADAALAAAALDAPARAWAERAAATAADHRGRYRAVLGAPPALQSASDDDPGELSPSPAAPARSSGKVVRSPPQKKVGPKRAPAKAMAAKASAAKKATRAKVTAAKASPRKRAPAAKGTSAKKASAAKTTAKKSTKRATRKKAPARTTPSR